MIETAFGLRRSAVFMDTLVTVHVASRRVDAGVEAQITRAFGWFGTVETACTRFDRDSEVMRLGMTIGRPQPLSDLLFEAIRFSLALARVSGGAFDPTVGAMLELRGFNRNYRTRRLVRSRTQVSGANYADLELDERNRTITLHRPLVIDLGAVAKGLAVDLAARELAPLEDFAVEAGGDLYVRGMNSNGEPWKVAIRHPLEPDRHCAVLTVSDMAVCSSGGYGRRSGPGAHHIVDARSAASPDDWISVTVLAPNAMLADGLSTAGLVLGPAVGRQLVSAQGAEGLWLSPEMRATVTPGLQPLLAPASEWH